MAQPSRSLDLNDEVFSNFPKKEVLPLGERMEPLLHIYASSMG
jgi:hypothetical protein